MLSAVIQMKRAYRDSTRINLREIFLSVQKQMLACLAMGDAFENPSACGSASEQHWIALFTRYLPQRYRASPAFVVDADGRRSRQIDIAIYDNLYSPLIFPHDSGLHIAAESVYAIFEVKQRLTPQLIRDAGRKAGSVRSLRRTSAPIISAGRPRAAIVPGRILAGILAAHSPWEESFQNKIAASLAALPPHQQLDFGCALRQGSFEYKPGRKSGEFGLCFSTPDEALIFFFIRFMERLRALGAAPAADLMEYGRGLQSLRPSRRAA
jgi:hypothetical protein